MAAVLDIAKGYLSHIDRSTSGITPLSFFEQQTGLPRSYAVLSGSGVYLALVFLNIGGMGQLLSNIAGFVIPGYYSLIALDTVSKADDTELLTYWVVFAFLNVIEFWSRAILYWIPFYFLFKTIFLLWAGIPPFGGSKVVYVNIIKPVTDKYIKKSASEKVSEAAEGVSTSVEI